MKRKFTLFATAALALIMVFSLAACGGGGGDTKAATVSFGISTLSMQTGEVKTVNYTVKGSSEGLVIKSSKTSVLSVKKTADGEIELTAKSAGTADVTATLGKSVAKISVTVKKSDITVEAKVVSVAPSKSETVKLTYENITVDGIPQVFIEGTGVTATIENNTAAGADLKIIAGSDAVLGTTTTVTVKAGGKEAKVEVDVASAGIVYGDGMVNGTVFESGKQGLMAKGLSADFAGTKLVFPRYAKYTKGGTSFWAPVMHIGNGLNDDDLAAPNFEVGEVKLTEVDTGDQAQYVQHMAFENMKTIRKVRLGANIQAIGRRSFNNVENVAEGVEQGANGEVGTLTFDGTIEELEIDENCKMTILGHAAFAGNNIKSIILPDTLTTLGIGAFRNCGVEVLKLPERWVDLNSGDDRFSMQFYDCYNLKTIYMPWQCCFSVFGDHYPNLTDDAKYVTDQRAGVLRSIFVDVSFTYNKPCKNDITVYYSGKEELLRNLMSVNAGVENSNHDGTNPHGAFTVAGALIVQNVWDNLFANSNLADNPTTDRNHVTWVFETSYPSTKA